MRKKKFHSAFYTMCEMELSSLDYVKNKKKEIPKMNK